mmetsp:Transcript_26001/g.59818  ORF Transcript_26001/g.59818 Transcript_26001/m.59818 type:complete len:204 (+) Transcript_26001:999-1610(+)
MRPSSSGIGGFGGDAVPSPLLLPAVSQDVPAQDVKGDHPGPLRVLGPDPPRDPLGVHRPQPVDHEGGGVLQLGQVFGSSHEDGAQEVVRRGLQAPLRASSVVELGGVGPRRRTSEAGHRQPGAEGAAPRVRLGVGTFEDGDGGVGGGFVPGGELGQGAHEVGLDGGRFGEGGVVPAADPAEEGAAVGVVLGGGGGEAREEVGG